MSSGISAARPDVKGDAYLDIRTVTRHFGGLVAVKDVSFAVRQGTIHALIGPNGAGKTTLFNLIAGVVRPTSGQIWFDGERIDGLPSHAVAARGIIRTFQTSRTFKNLSLLENVLVGAHLRVDYDPLSAALRLPRFRRTERMLREEALAALESVGLADHCQETARNLPYGKQHLLELARAVVSRPSLLLLDELAAGLNEGESVVLAERLQGVRASGATLLLIEHNMRFVMGISDCVTVLNFGSKIADDCPTVVQNQPEVIDAYLGTGGGVVIESNGDTTK